MNAQITPKPPERLFCLDNLKVFLTILVVLHHAAGAYGGHGDGNGRAVYSTISYKSKVIRKARSTCCIISVDNVPR